MNRKRMTNSTLTALIDSLNSYFEEGVGEGMVKVKRALTLDEDFPLGDRVIIAMRNLDRRTYSESIDRNLERSEFELDFTVSIYADVRHVVFIEDVYDMLYDFVTGPNDLSAKGVRTSELKHKKSFGEPDQMDMIRITVMMKVLV